jgi:ketol-acid reductoisomerase
VLFVRSQVNHQVRLNIVEVGEQIRKDITVVMVAPKCPGTEVREEYKRPAPRRLSSAAVRSAQRQSAVCPESG